MREPISKVTALKCLDLYLKKAEFEPMSFYSNRWSFMFVNDQAIKNDQDLVILPFEDEKFYQAKVDRAVQWFKGNEAGYW